MKSLRKMSVPLYNEKRKKERENNERGRDQMCVCLEGGERIMNQICKLRCSRIIASKFARSFRKTISKKNLLSQKIN